MTSAAHSEALVSPLHDRHVALGAKLGDFGGWLMPLEYPGGGVVEEHRAVRERVGLFDVSHLGKFTVRGPGARALIDSVLTNDTQRIAPRRAQYSMLCNEAGGVVDDLYLYLNGDDDVFVIPNASNASTVVAAVSAAAPAAVEVTNRHRDFAIIAVQGPRSAGLLDAVGLPSSMKFTSFLVADRVTAASTATRSCYPPIRPPNFGTTCSSSASRSACCLAVSVPATRFERRWAIRCTDRISRLRSLRYKPEPFGPLAGRSWRSSDGPR
jgi:aminomethyltransferase